MTEVRHVRLSDYYLRQILDNLEVLQSLLDEKDETIRNMEKTIEEKEDKISDLEDKILELEK